MGVSKTVNMIHLSVDIQTNRKLQHIMNIFRFIEYQSSIQNVFSFLKYCNIFIFITEETILLVTSFHAYFIDGVSNKGKACTISI